MGDPALDEGHRVKEWWLRSHFRGPVMGSLPDSMLLAGAESDESTSSGSIIVPYRFWSFGTDHTTMRKLEWDWSSHIALNAAGFSGVDPSFLLFGPSLGFGLNLTWWDQWKSVTGKTINTGKITAEAGWIAGFSINDTLYAQGRATGHFDLFGTHQVNMNLSGIAGFSLARFRVPFGLELAAERDSGDDTFDTRKASSYSLHASIHYRLLPSSPDPQLKVLMDSMRDVLEMNTGAGTPPFLRPQDQPVDDALPAVEPLPHVETGTSLHAPLHDEPPPADATGASPDHGGCPGQSTVPATPAPDGGCYDPPPAEACDSGVIPLQDEPVREEPRTQDCKDSWALHERSGEAGEDCPAEDSSQDSYSGERGPGQ